MRVLVIFQGPAYGTETAYNGLRLAGNLAKRDAVDVRIFCFGDAVGARSPGSNSRTASTTSTGWSPPAVHHGAAVGLCGTCMDARGITEAMIIPAARRSNLDDATDWVLWADKVITF